MTPIDRLTGRRISFAIQHRARLAICQHVRGVGEVGPRWRKGSNAFQDNPLGQEGAPCLHCGSTKGMASWNHYLCCESCGWDTIAGDYDWWSLADVLRYQRDKAEGMVE